MSLTMILIPMAVAVCVTSAETILSIKEKCRNAPKGESEDIQTRFADATLLQETLKEHGIKVISCDNDHIEATFEMGKILYYRNGEDESYRMKIFDISDVEGFICNLDMLEKEYDLNVQSYTYNRVMMSIPDNMFVESEKVLDDDSILITLSVE